MPTLESIQYLASKEQEICDMYKDGQSSNKIAKQLGYSSRVKDELNFFK